jgi:phenylpropionate dioxygenase-like ring-hydroxylating dioxygenase large terminal subunit
MPFLRNCWYVASWSSDLTSAPLGRRILNDPIVIFRSSTGEPVALSGRCPHRFAPLHLGKVIEDRIQCPYHGLRFNSAGACVFNPQGNGATPSALRVRAYPLIERYGALWIWMGDPQRADAAQIPDYPFLADPRLARIEGYLHSKANFELLTDNIMDLGHVDFLHAGSLGCDATAKAKTTITRSGNSIRCDRWMANERQGPLLGWLFGKEGRPVDAWVDVIWNPPSLMQLNFGMTEVGASRDAGGEIPNVHFMTPETEFSTHYFWASTRDFRTDDLALSQQLYDGVTAAFTLEDKPMIEAQQEMMGTTDLWALKPALLAGDTAPVMVRRALAKLVEEERVNALPGAEGPRCAASAPEIGHVFAQ